MEKERDEKSGAKGLLGDGEKKDKETRGEKIDWWRKKERERVGVSGRTWGVGEKVWEVDVLHNDRWVFQTSVWEVDVLCVRCMFNVMRDDCPTVWDVDVLQCKRRVFYSLVGGRSPTVCLVCVTVCVYLTVRMRDDNIIMYSTGPHAGSRQPVNLLSFSFSLPHTHTPTHTH